MLFSCKRKECKNAARFELRSNLLLDVKVFKPNPDLPLNDYKDKVVLLNDSATYARFVQSRTNLARFPEQENLPESHFKTYNYLFINIKTGIPECYTQPFFFSVEESVNEYSLSVAICKKKKNCFPKTTTTLMVLIKTERMKNLPVNFSIRKM